MRFRDTLVRIKKRLHKFHWIERVENIKKKVLATHLSGFGFAGDVFLNFDKSAQKRIV